jgi:putative DNA primase/helicase
VQAPALEPQDCGLPFEWASDLDRERLEINEIVSGVLTDGGFSMVYGDSNSGKTYMVMLMCLSIASNTPWLGCPVAQGRVIYVACEGVMSIRRRYFAHCQHFGLTSVQGFGIVPTTVNLMDPSADVDKLIDLIGLHHYPERDEPVQLIVIDTLARAMTGGNENDSEDMSRLVSGVDRIREATGAHVMVIHHSGKDAAKGARGHSSLRAALDTEMEVTGDEASSIHTARITKQRDLATKGQRFAARFVSVELGTDQWGKPITACALEPVAPADVPPPAPKSRKAERPAHAAVLAYLSKSNGVFRVVIAKQLARPGLSRPTIYRAINDLLEAGLITHTGEQIYLPKGIK